MMRKTEDGGRKTGGGGRKTVFGPRSPVSFAWRLARDTDGQALLETVIALPVLFIFILVVMELSMMYNAKQLANYAAFCAARTAAVYGVDSTAKRHFAAAMAMSSIASGTNDDANDILQAYGVNDPNQTVAAICSIPGFQEGSDRWRARLANAYLRTYLPQCDTTGTPAGRRKHVTVNVTYIYRCNFAPFGIFWGKAGIDAYCAALTAFSYHNGYTYAVVAPFIAILEANWRRNITIHGRAVTDYWAG
jgi:Flp pilus assembly protein TadG